MKHLADHRTTSAGARMVHFLRLDRTQNETVWAPVFQRSVLRNKGNRRVVEFVRIERGHDV